MQAAIIIFPGTNREHDAFDALTLASMANIEFVWHKNSGFENKPDLIIIPGGFSWGDYLRAGAIAAQSPIMKKVAALAKAGTRVIGICNGFQILCEAGLLHGNLMRNRDLNFIARPCFLKVEHAGNIATKNYQAGDVVIFPVAHHDGNYFATPDVLKELEECGQILFRYTSQDGGQDGLSNNLQGDDATNINGSKNSIAGICNAAGNVIGMMPHPENATMPYHPSRDGIKLFESLCHG